MVGFTTELGRRCSHLSLRGRGRSEAARGERAFIATMQASIVNAEGGMRRNQEEEARKQFWMHKIWVHLD